MIQRIQSLYLLVAAALVAVALFAPLAWFSGGAQGFALHAFALRADGGEVVQPTLYLGVLLAAACVLPIFTIFLFRRRLLQIRLCAVEVVLLVGGLVMEGVYYLFCQRFFVDYFDFSARIIRPAAALPLAALVFVALAARAIFRDELLVRAADRIR